jgi:hypothetical protein
MVVAASAGYPSPKRLQNLRSIPVNPVNGNKLEDGGKKATCSTS